MTWTLIGIVLIFGVILPTIIIWVSKQSPDTLRTFEFEAKWSAIYGQLKFQSPGQLLYSLFYVLERWFYAIMCFLEYMVDHPAIQMILMIYFFQFNSLYQANYMPFRNPMQNRLEMTNKCFFILHLYMNTCYTDFVVTPED